MRTITIVSPSGMFLTIGKELAERLHLRNGMKIGDTSKYLKILLLNVAILKNSIEASIELDKIMEENSI